MMQLELAKNNLGAFYGGIGGITSNGATKLLFDYPQDVQDEILDILFKPGCGCELQHLKVEIGSDANTTNGTEPSHMRSRDDFEICRGFGLELAARAKKRRPDLILDALRWGTPAWIESYDDKLLYYLNFLKGARDVYGLEFSYLGPDINEGSFDAKWCTDVLRPGLDENGFAHIKLIAADSEKDWSIAIEVHENEKLKNSLACIGSHYQTATTHAAKSLGLPLWNSEELAPYRHHFETGSLLTPYKILRMYPDGGMVKAELHPIIEGQYDSTLFPWKGMIAASAPWSGHYQLSQGLWCVAQISHFAKPGWRYIDSACTYDEYAAVCAFASPDLSDGCIVFANTGGTPRQYLLLEDETFSKIEWRGFVTTETLRMAPANEVLQGGVVTVPPFCVLTLAGKNAKPINVPQKTQQKKAEPFPALLKYDFNNEPWRQPKYFTDQSGAFEIVQDANGSALCQMLEKHQKPVDWTPLKTPEPFSPFGSTLLYDYRLSVEAEIENSAESYVLLGGRMQFWPRSANYPGGYYARIYGNGSWKLMLAETVLAEGVVLSTMNAEDCILKVDASLTFLGSQITLAAFGKELACIQCTTFRSGQAVIGSGYHKARFTSLKLENLNLQKTECIRVPVFFKTLEWEGEWETLRGDYRHFYRHAKQAGGNAKLQFSFEGTGFYINGQRTGAKNVIAVVDGASKNTLTPDGEGFRQSLLGIENLANSRHTVTLEFEEGTCIDSIEFY